MSMWDGLRPGWVGSHWTLTNQWSNWCVLLCVCCCSSEDLHTPPPTPYLYVSHIRPPQEEYAYETEAHLYLHDRLTKFDWDTLYDLHYTLITIGKVFCTKRAPNCSQCPLKDQCEYAKNGGPRLATDTVPFAPPPAAAPPAADPMPPQPLPDVEDTEQCRTSSQGSLDEQPSPPATTPFAPQTPCAQAGVATPPQGRQNWAPAHRSGAPETPAPAAAASVAASTAAGAKRVQLVGAEEVARILELATDEWHVVGGADREAMYAQSHT